MSNPKRLKPGFRIGASFKVRFAPTGSALCTLGKRVTLWNVDKRERVTTGPPIKHASELDFSPVGDLVAVKNTLGEIVVLTSDSMTEVNRFSGRPYGEGSEILFSPGGEFLVDGSWSGQLVVRESVSGVVVWTEHHEGAAVRNLASTNDRQVWFYTRQRTDSAEESVLMRHWPFAGNAPLEVARGALPWAVVPSRDGSLLAVAESDSLEIVDLVAGPDQSARVARLDDLPISGTGHALSWDCHGAYVAYSGSGRIRVFSRDLEQIHETPLEYACDVAFSPDGKLLALGD